MENNPLSPMTGEPITLDVTYPSKRLSVPHLSDDITVRKLKGLMRRHFGLDRKTQMIVSLDTHALRDDWTIQDMNLAANSVIDVQIYPQGIPAARNQTFLPRPRRSELDGGDYELRDLKREFSDVDVDVILAIVAQMAGDCRLAREFLLSSPE